MNKQRSFNFPVLIATILVIFWVEMISIEKSWPRDTISVKNTYQFVIIGGGLVGCALFHELTAVYGNQVLLIENNSEPTSIYTSGNNGYCNTAFNLPTTRLASKHITLIQITSILNII